MKISRVLFSLLFLLSLGPLATGWGAAKEEATFSLVKGSVKVSNPGGVNRRAKSGQPAFPGETIQVGTKSSANLALPDGSSLNLSPNTRLTITNLKQPSLREKTFLFRLGIGKVFAQVRKLFSAKSSFEIEAGGVVCGVRGTEFSVGYDPDTKKMELEVFNGAVGALGSGVSQVFTTGHSGRFQGGHWDGKIGNAPPPPKDAGKEGNGKGNVGASVVNNSNGNSSNSTEGGNNGNPAPGDNTSSGTGGNNPSSNGDDTTTIVPGGSSNTTGTGNTTIVPGFQPNTALGDLDNQFFNGIAINTDNNITSAQQTLHIHLVVP